MRVAMLLLVIIFLGLVVVLPRYLSPNDIRQCQLGPQEADVRCQSADAIVAVSGGDTTARTMEAIRLYEAGWAPLIIFSGAAEDKSGPSNALSMKRLAVAEGVPADSILIEEFSRNTAENARNTSRFIEERQLERVIVVTSAYHQRRAGMEFRSRLGGRAVIVNHPVERDAHWGPYWWLSAQGWRLALGETVKIIYLHSAPPEGFDINEYR